MTNPGPRSQVRRMAKRGEYDREPIYKVLDEGLVAHVAFVVEGQPFVIPMAYARDGDDLILHGSVASRLLKSLATGIEVSVCVTLLDGLVLARSVFEHSMNYRSVVAFGVAKEVTETDEKLRALDRLTEHLIPGRVGNAREPSRKELGATTVLTMPIKEASLKARQGDVDDNPKDLDLPHWAGIIPLKQAVGEPEADVGCEEVEVPDHVANYSR